MRWRMWEAMLLVLGLGIVLVGTPTLHLVTVPAPLPAAVVEATPIELPAAEWQLVVTPRTWDRLQVDDPAAVDPAALHPSTPLEVFRATIALSSWPIDEWADVERHVACESGFNPRKVGAAGERGWGQILPSAHPDQAERYNLFDPADNLQAMFEIVHGYPRPDGTWAAPEGWTPWSCR